MKTAKSQAAEKLAQYGLPALTERELLDVLKHKGSADEYYASPEYKAAKELIRRKETPNEVKITSSADAVKLLSFLQSETEEHFWAIFLNRANKVVRTEFISKGNATGCVVDIQKILRRALELKAQNLIISHNHPSGNNNPSAADKQITDKLKNAAALMDIGLLDHVIITPTSHFSFADENLI